MRKTLIVLLALSSLAYADKDKKDTAASTSRNAGAKVSLERVIAIVNDAIILESELDARLFAVTPPVVLSKQAAELSGDWWPPAVSVSIASVI